MQAVGRGPFCHCLSNVTYFMLNYRKMHVTFKQENAVTMLFFKRDLETLYMKTFCIRH